MSAAYLCIAIAFFLYVLALFFTTLFGIPVVVALAQRVRGSLEPGLEVLFTLVNPLCYLVGFRWLHGGVGIHCASHPTFDFALAASLFGFWSLRIFGWRLNSEFVRRAAQVTASIGGVVGSWMLFADGVRTAQVEHELISCTSSGADTCPRRAP